MLYNKFVNENPCIDSDYENGYSIYGTTMPNLSPTFGPDYGLEKWEKIFIYFLNFTKKN